MDSQTFNNTRIFIIGENHYENISDVARSFLDNIDDMHYRNIAFGFEFGESSTVNGQPDIKIKDIIQAALKLYPEINSDLIDYLTVNLKLNKNQPGHTNFIIKYWKYLQKASKYNNKILCMEGKKKPFYFDNDNETLIKRNKIIAKNIIKAVNTDLQVKIIAITGFSHLDETSLQEKSLINLLNKRISLYEIK